MMSVTVVVVPSIEMIAEPLSNDSAETVVAATKVLPAASVAFERELPPGAEQYAGTASEATDMVEATGTLSATVPVKQTVSVVAIRGLALVPLSAFVAGSSLTDGLTHTERKRWQHNGCDALRSLHDGL